jgi:RNA polymerase sigma-70 factor (ECF subfamily)
VSTETSGPAPEDSLIGLGANEAVAELMARLGDKIFGFSLKFCGNREDAEDLVQETFLQAFRNWGQFEGRSTPSSWLYTIAARGCQRMNRKRKGEPRRIDSLDEQLPSGLTLTAKLPSREADPLDEELRREAAEIVDRALARLPANYRLPLVLKEIAELSLREIATILGLKEATVKTRVHRARFALRAELTRHMGETKEPTGDHPHQVCLDLLRSKMEAMDRGAVFPVDRETMCDRCREFVDSLDMAAEACRWIRGDGLPDRLRTRLVSEFEGSANSAQVNRR